MSEEAEILFEVRGSVGVATLNRPRALNALTADMCVALRDQLKDWATMPSVAAVVVVGAGEKAFCAGGDVVKVSKSWAAGTDDWRRFFREEYLMNVAIDAFPKPYISLLDGITMGGGVGVSMPGSARVVSEKTLFAMPETGLGLFPDVGGGWFLPRLPGEVGTWLALTGARLKAADMYALGLATHHVPSDQMAALLDALTATDPLDADAVDAILARFHQDPDPAPIVPVMELIDDLFDYDSVEEIIAALERTDDVWAQDQAKFLSKKSPTSMKITLEQLRRGRGLSSFPDVMQMEYRMVNHVIRGQDFHEGVRAILIDKDHSPTWAPATLAEVSDEDVAGHFAPLGAGAELPLDAV